MILDQNGIVNSRGYASDDADIKLNRLPTLQTIKHWENLTAYTRRIRTL